MSADGGGSVPHIASLSALIGTTWFASSSKAASSTRCFPRGTVSIFSPQRTASGPSMQNSTVPGICLSILLSTAEDATYHRYVVAKRSLRPAGGTLVPDGAKARYGVRVAGTARRLPRRGRAAGDAREAADGTGRLAAGREPGGPRR